MDDAPDSIPPLFSIDALRDFHAGLEGELDRFLEGVQDVPGIETVEYEEDNIRAFEQVRGRALELAAKAYIGEHAGIEDVERIGIDYTHPEDTRAVVHALRKVSEADPPLNEQQRSSIDNFLAVLRSYEGVPFVHPRALQMPRVRAALDAARDVTAAASSRMQHMSDSIEQAGESFEEGEHMGVDYRSALKQGARGVAAAEEGRAHLVQLQSRNDAVHASAGDYANVVQQSERFSDVAHRVAVAMKELCEGDPCGLSEAHSLSLSQSENLDREVESLRELASRTLEDIIAKYQSFTRITQDMCAAAKQCRLTMATSNHVKAALAHFTDLVDKESALFEAKSEGATSSARLAENSAAFLRDFTSLTSERLERHSEDVERRIAVTQAALHMSAHRYFQVLKGQEEQERQVVELVDQKQACMSIRAVDSTVAATLAHEQQQALTKIQFITEEIDKVRALLDQHGVNEAMRRQNVESFLDTYDQSQREDDANKFFSKIVTRVKEWNETVAELVDTPQHHARSAAWVKDAAKKAMSALYSILITASDATASLGHARELTAPDAASLTSKVKRHTRTAAQIFTELNDTHPAVVKHEATAYALPDGGRAANLYILATPVFSALEACVRILTSASTDRQSLDLPPAPSHSTPAFSPPNAVEIAFENVSPRLRFDGNRLSKPSHLKDVADGSALCSPSIPGGSGVVSWSVRILHNAEHLMVGVADSSLPVTGYCNAVQYPRAYFLNVTSGTLWAPSLRYEGRSYWPEPLDDDGSIITVVLDTSRGTIAFAHNGRELGVAFVGVNTNRPLQPAFEVTAGGCEFELLPP